jgi:predicted transposase YdaD
MDSTEAREAHMTIAQRLREEGKLEGKLEGRLEGKLEGEMDGKKRILLRLLEKKFGLVETERQKILSIQEQDRLDRAIDLLLDAQSTREVLQALE